MYLRNVRWVSEFLQSMELEDMGGGFWTSGDGARSIYLGRSGMIVMTSRKGEQDFESSHPYPSDVTEDWFLDSIMEHGELLLDSLDDLSLN